MGFEYFFGADAVFDFQDVDDEGIQVIARIIEATVCGADAPVGGVVGDHLRAEQKLSGFHFVAAVKNVLVHGFPCGGIGSLDFEEIHG